MTIQHSSSLLKILQNVLKIQSPKRKKKFPRFAGIVFVSFKEIRSACKKSKAGCRAVSALRARGSCSHTKLQVPVCARNAEQGSCDRMNINTRDLDNLEVILFSACFYFFLLNFFLPLKRVQFGLVCIARGIKSFQRQRSSTLIE